MARPAQRHKLSRTRDQRRALLKGLAESLVLHESIVTTRPKARALKPYAEKLITKAKVDNQHHRRLVARKLSTPASVEKLFTDIGPRFSDRPGGYTRIEAAGWRRGDDAEMARISLVEKRAPAAPAATEAEKSDTPTEAKPKAAPKAAPAQKPATAKKKAPAKKPSTAKKSSKETT